MHTVKQSFFGNRLASAQSNSQGTWLLIGLSGVLLLAMGSWAGRVLQSAGLVTPLFNSTLIWCALPYGVAAQLMYRAAPIPAREQTALLLLNTSLPFLVLVLAFALLQQSYSRGAVLLMASSTLVGFWLCDRFLLQRRVLRLLVLDEQAARALEFELSRTPKGGAPSKVELVRLTGTDNPRTEIVDGALVGDQVPEIASFQAQLAELKKAHVRLYSAAAVAEAVTGCKSLSLLRNPFWQPDPSPAYDAAKRLIDVAVVLATAPLWIPLCAGIALAIRLDSKGPALFRQPRMGRLGRTFTILKFRTMAHLPSPGVERYAEELDSRVTRIGRWLRRSRLDEIPQLINVLRGEMSLIGPRPEQVAFAEKYAVQIPSYPYRHLVRPGLAGWAQVMQGYAASTDETELKLGFDLYYVSHYSPSLDLLIAAKTAKTVLTGFGAR